MGGINAAIQGENLWAGVAHGATVGAVTGLAVDVGLAVAATGGAAAIAAGIGIAAVGGFFTGTLGDATSQVLFEGKSFDTINWEQSIVVGGITATINILTFGLSSIASAAIGKSTSNLFRMVSKEFTPAWSWVFQSITGWTYPAFTLLPGLAHSRVRGESPVNG